MADTGLSNQLKGRGIVQLPLIAMETEWQSHREHESGAFGQPLVFKDRRGSRMPGRVKSQDGAGGRGGKRGLIRFYQFSMVGSRARTSALFQSGALG